MWPAPGEAIELRRKDLSDDCVTLTVSRGVTRGSDGYHVSTTKSGKARSVVLPPHIRADVKHHLDVYAAKDANALLFPDNAGKHLSDTVFRRNYFHPVAKAIGREGLWVHDLRHFHGCQIAASGPSASRW